MVPFYFGWTKLFRFQSSELEECAAEETNYKEDTIKENYTKLWVQWVSIISKYYTCMSIECSTTINISMKPNKYTIKHYQTINQSINYLNMWMNSCKFDEIVHPFTFAFVDEWIVSTCSNVPKYSARIIKIACTMHR